jgi:hypothetical protein
MATNESAGARPLLGLWQDFIRRVTKQQYGRFELRSDGVYGFSNGKKSPAGKDGRTSERGVRLRVAGGDRRESK